MEEEEEEEERFFSDVISRHLPRLRDSPFFLKKNPSLSLAGRPAREMTPADAAKQIPPKNHDNRNTHTH